MDNKYLTIRLGDLKAIVNKLAVKMMLTVIIPGYDDIEEGQVERRNVLAACYNCLLYTSPSPRDRG